MATKMATKMATNKACGSLNSSKGAGVTWTASRSRRTATIPSGESKEGGRRLPRASCRAVTNSGQGQSHTTSSRLLPHVSSLSACRPSYAAYPRRGVLQSCSASSSTSSSGQGERQLGKLLELFEEFAEAAQDGTPTNGVVDETREQQQAAQQRQAMAQMEALKLELEETKGKMADIEKELVEMSDAAADISTAKSSETETETETVKSLQPLISEFKQLLQESLKTEATEDGRAEAQAHVREEEEEEEEVALVQYQEDVGQLELEIEKLKVKALQVDVLEEKVEAAELAARMREKELLVLLEEKERAIATLEQVVGDQEKFVAEMRQVEIKDATSEEGNQDGRLLDMEAQLMNARATIAEVEAEKLALERKMNELQEEALSGKRVLAEGEGRDPLLPPPAQATTTTATAASAADGAELVVDQERISQQEKLIESLQKQVKEQEDSLANLQNQKTDDSSAVPAMAEVEAEAIRNAKMDQQVARIRQLEIEMSQMATVQESDELARELTEAKMTVHQLQQELELVRLSALNPAIESNSPPPPPAALPSKKTPKSKSNGHDSGLKNGLFERTIPGQFVLKKKHFVPKNWQMNGNSKEAGKKKQKPSTFVLRKKEFSPKEWPRGAAFLRNPKGSFVLQKKQFLPKQIPAAKGKGLRGGKAKASESMSKREKNDFVLKKKEFTPKQLPRTKPFVRSPKGSFVLQKRHFTPKQISVSVKVSRTSMSKDPNSSVFFSQESLKNK